jgi:O-methyltransferase
MRSFLSVYRHAAGLIAAPLAYEFFLTKSVGHAYGLTFRDKLKLMRRIRAITEGVPGATSYHEHLLLSTYLLSVPPSVQGVVVECGCFKGRSTATLSLLCEITNRQLVVFDSFEGLPEVGEEDRIHVALHDKRYEEYRQGEYAGTVEEVCASIRRFGEINRCRMVRGYFDHSLSSFRETVAFAFLDVDLYRSLKTCLRNLWPLLDGGGYLFTHEARQLAFAATFFDQDWWRTELNSDAPGLIGAGCGLPAGINRCTGLGYACKYSDSGQAKLETGFRTFCGDPTQARFGYSRPEGPSLVRS